MATARLREAIVLLSKAITRPREAIARPREAIALLSKAIGRPREAIEVVRKTITPPRKAIGHPREAIEVVRKAITPPRKAFENFLTFLRQVPFPFPRSGKKDCPQCVLQCLQGPVRAAFVCCFDAFKEGTSVEVVKKFY